MTGNSQITGHQNTGATTLANGLGAVVHVESGGTLTMYGGRIHNNMAYGQAVVNRVGGVSVAGTLRMEGGVINENTRWPTSGIDSQALSAGPADVIIVDGGTQTGTGIGQIVEPDTSLGPIQ